MKFKTIILCFLLVASISFAGDEMTIKAFDRTNLNRLNNILRQLQRDNIDLRNQIKDMNGGSVAVETRKSGEMYVPQSNIVGFQRDDGTTDLYVDEEGEQINIGIPNTGKVHLTPASQTVPSSYFLDLHCSRSSATTWQMQASWLTLHDAFWNTLGLSEIDEFNDVTVAGPTAGGRDQAGAFSNEWVYFWIIYNPSTQEISSLSSEYYEAPLALPEGFTYYTRVSSSYYTGTLSAGKQLGQRIWIYTPVEFDHVGVNEAHVLNISTAIPATARRVQGYFGPIEAVAANRDAWIASSEGAFTINQRFHLSGAAALRFEYFDLPIYSTQNLTFYTETADETWRFRIHSYDERI